MPHTCTNEYLTPIFLCVKLLLRLMSHLEKGAYQNEN